MKTASALLLSLLLAAPTARAEAPPANGTERHVTLELLQAKVPEVLRLLASLAGEDVVIPGCAEAATVDLKLRNVPLGVVYQALAAKLGLTYHLAGRTRVITCAGESGGVDLERRVDVELDEVELTEVLARIAALAGLDGARYDGPARSVSLTLKGARLATVIHALSDVAALEGVWVEGRVLRAVGAPVTPGTDGGTE